MTDPASFIGVACEGEWAVVVLERALWPAVDRGVDNGAISAGDALSTFRTIRSRAIEESRLVIAWSTREHDEITSIVHDDDEVEWWQSNLVNAIPIAKKWALRNSISIRETPSTHGTGTSKNSLAAYMEAVGYSVPHAFGPGNSAQRIRHVRNQLNRVGSFQKLTRTTKGKWTKCLQHNRHDCLGMAAVVQRCVVE